MRHSPSAAAVLVAIAIASWPVSAQQQPSEIGTFGAWTSWSGSDADGATCYAAASPRSSQPGGVSRDPISFMVIHRMGGGTRNEVQSILGYPINTTDAKASVDIDGQTFGMVADGSVTWLADSSQETAFVAAMKAGTTMTVKATSQRGTDTVDIYSLSGTTKALEAIDAACS